MVIRRDLVVRKSRAPKEKPTHMQFVLRNLTQFDIAIKAGEIWNRYPDGVIFEERRLVVYRQQYYSLFAQIHEGLLAKESSLRDPIVFLARSITPYNRVAELKQWMRQSPEKVPEPISFHAFHVHLVPSQTEFCAEMITEMYKIQNIYEIYFQITLDFDVMPVEPIPRSIALSKTALQNYVHLTGIDVEEDVVTAQDFKRNQIDHITRQGKEEENLFKCHFLDNLFEWIFPTVQPQPILPANAPKVAAPPAKQLQKGAISNEQLAPIKA
ncbi:hypothetical protein WR25_11291 [Diploscapter pachys]|uniref:Uncharacterized protein n=1 Tax=Diploscapter pachys TaxID=2018661 RepID=A0A2A2KB34_9BILA|nr:hypothetical protein WR25_11291 [Diploscapter pachys]